jgi:hypothetical protein
MSILIFFLHCTRFFEYLRRIPMKALKDDLKPGPNIARMLDVDAATLRRWRREGVPVSRYRPRSDPVPINRSSRLASNTATEAFQEIKTERMNQRNTTEQGK